MNLTMASMDSEDDQARTRNIELNEFTIRGGKSLYKSIKLITSIILMVIVFSLSLSLFPFIPHGGFLTLYSSLSTILFLQLLII